MVSLRFQVGGLWGLGLVLTLTQGSGSVQCSFGHSCSQNADFSRRLSERGSNYSVFSVSTRTLAQEGLRG